MKNKYSKKFEEEMIALAPTNELERLFWVARCKYNYPITKTQLRQYLYKRNIIYKDYNVNKKRNMGDKLHIGSERVKPDGMVQVKVSKNKWMYKQRYIYSKYYNIELTSDDYIIFLDQDRTNFNIDNLKKISRHESSILSNQKIFSNNPEATKTGIQIAKLMIKLKQRSNKNETKNS